MLKDSEAPPISTGFKEQNSGFIMLYLHPSQAWASREADIQRGLLQYAIRRASRNPLSSRTTHMLVT